METPTTQLASSILSAKRQRDSEWTSQVLGLSGQILTPEEAALWLQRDRIQRAREVSDSSRFKGRPKRY